MKKAIKIGIFCCLSCFVLILGVYVYAFFSPRLELKNMGKVFIYDHEENLIYQGSGSSEWISLNDISQDYTYIYLVSKIKISIRIKDLIFQEL